MNPRLIDKLQFISSKLQLLKQFEYLLDTNPCPRKAEWDASLSSDRSESNNLEVTPKGRWTNTKQSDKNPEHKANSGQPKFAESCLLEGCPEESMWATS